MNQVAEVAIGLPISKTFHYLVPEGMRTSIQPGMRVMVPFKGRKVTGFVLDLADRPPEGLPDGLGEKLREVEALPDKAPLIDSKMLRFYRWIADYYLYPLGEVIKTGLPPGLHVKSETFLSLTPEGLDSIVRGEQDPLQEKVFNEIKCRGQIPLRKVLNAFHGELSRPTILAWKTTGLLRMDSGIESKEVKPKFERVVRFQGETPAKPLSKKRSEILQWIEEKREVAYSELAKKYKSPSEAIRFLEASGLVSIGSREVCRLSSSQPGFRPYRRPDLTRDQEAVFGEIAGGISSKRFSPFLIHGVTGSGKTEIYLRAIEEVLAQGREAIVLVPEISLTPQLLSRFRDRFGENLCLLHSRLGKGERYDQWRKVLRGEVSIAIGARSAIFAPFRKLGIVIVDEEHEPSYKQEEKLKYHARDLAVVRGQQADATVLLGSATPSLESYFNAEKGKFRLLHLPERMEGRPLPRVDVVDMKEEKALLSQRMQAGLRKNMEDKKQSLLFLNRRGFANFILCPECGFTFKCPNCSVTLTHHFKERTLQCHYCDHRIEAPGDCPQCRGHGLRGVGIGTERLEQELQTLFPTARVERMDRDTTSRKRSHQEILGRLESGQTDILVGTQMIVKGHDFPNVTFVGVVAADASLHFPDFRSSERTFQLLTQVAGRAGRGETVGEAVVQTFNPDHYSILRARDHDFPGFYREEIRFREALGYPPFSRLVNFRVVGNSEKKTRAVAELMGKAGQFLLEEGFHKGIELLGPSTAPLARMKGRFRWQMLAKGRSPRLLHQFARALEARLEDRLKERGIRLDVDVDPVFIL